MSNAPAALSVPAHQRAGYALWVLSLINLVNYLDRYIIAIVLPRIQADFGISDTQAGLLATVFIVVFMLASPLGGYLGDRWPRRLLIAGSVLLWSLATMASGLASSFFALLIARAFIGMGEAGYGVIAPSFISDLYPRERRARMLAYFYVAIPVGAALGFVLGGWIAEAYSWHMAFFVGGLPGIILAGLAFTLPTPVRGGMDGEAGVARLPFQVGLRGLARNRPFWATTAGYTLTTFSLGGLAFWMPTYLVRERGMLESHTGFVFGAITASAGLLGTLAGGWLGDWMEKKAAGGALRLSAYCLFLAAPCMYVAATLRDHNAIFAAIFVAQFLLFLNSGPINAALVNAVPPTFRAFAVGLNVLCIHLLGDAISPPLIGVVADRASLELAVKLNALPVFAGGVALLLAARAFAHAPAPRTSQC